MSRIDLIRTCHAPLWVMGWMVLVGYSDEALGQGKSGGQAVQVEISKPVRRAMTRTLNMPATLTADESVDLFANVSGYIESVQVDIGDRVSAGDVLIKISVPEMLDELRQATAILEARRTRVEALKAKVTQAESRVQTAAAQVERFEAERHLRRITLQRQEALRKGNAIPEQALDDSKGGLAVADAQVRIAGTNVDAAKAERLSAEADVKVASSEMMVASANVARLTTLMAYTTIRAPFDGLIHARFVDSGAFVRSAAQGPTTPLLSVSKVDRLRLVLEIPETDAPFVHVGTSVSVNVVSLRGDPMTAAVSRTAASIRPGTRTMRAEVDLDNADGRLAAGMYAQVAITLETKKLALMIESKAIRVEGKKTSVLVAEDGVARSKPVGMGYDDGIWTEVVSGLDGNESIIVSSNGVVGPGAPVRVMTTGQPVAGSPKASGL